MQRFSLKRFSAEGSITGDPRRYVTKDPACGHVSIEAPLGNLEGIRLPGLLREKNSISGLFSWTQRTLRFEVWGPSGTLVKGQGSPELISDYGAQRARL